MNKALKITLCCLSGLIVLTIALLFAVTFYLTPERLSELISREMTENLNAEVKIENARFTFWSSFPRLMLETDSVVITSHNLDRLPEKELKKLPGNPRLLATAESLEGGINILGVLKGSYLMHDLDVSGLHINLVAVNDSINNYDILPPRKKQMEHLPFFTTNILSFKNNKGIDIYFAKTHTKGHVDLEKAVMRRLEKDTDYTLDMVGKISASIADLHLFKNFPFELGGNINLGFHPFSLKFDNFAINLESLKSRLNMTLDLQDGMKISNLNYQVSMVNLMKLLKSVPWLPIGDLSDIDANFEVELSATLDRPYTFATGELPWVTVAARVNGGSLDYKTSQGDVIPVSYSDVLAGLRFNGTDPGKSQAFLKPVNIKSEGTEVSLSGSVTELLGSPSVKLAFSGESNLASVAGRVSDLKGWNLEGKLKFNGEASGRMESITPQGIQKGLQKVEFSAAASAFDLEGSNDREEFRIGSLNLTAASRQSLPLTNDFVMAGLQKELDNLSVEAALQLDDVTFQTAGNNASISKINISALTQPNTGQLVSELEAQGIRYLMEAGTLDVANITVNTTASPESSELNTTIGIINAAYTSQVVSAKAGKVSLAVAGYASPKELHDLMPADIKGLKRIVEGTRLNVENAQCSFKDYNLDIASVAIEADNGGNDHLGLKLSGKNAHLSDTKGNAYNIENLNAATTLKGLETGDLALDNTSLKAGNLDLTIAREARLALRDASVTYGKVAPKRYLPGQPVSPESFYVTLKSTGGQLKLADSKVTYPLRNIDVYFNPDSLNIYSLGVACLQTDANISGTAVNLREFLASGNTAPLKLNFNIACDTININQLAHTFYKEKKSNDAENRVKTDSADGKHHRHDLQDILKAQPITESDLTTVAIPKNIEGVLNVHIGHSIYTDVHLYDLGGTITVADGKATIHDVGINSDFGQASAEIEYNTSDIQNMSLAVNASMQNVDVVKFFQCFHKLLEKMPQMSNLEGTVDASVQTDFLIFPNMDINMPSLTATIDITGQDLKLHQSELIHKIANKMFIHGDEDLKINDIDLKLRIRDNLVELYPFDFQVDRYAVELVGTNNFNGDMYYHIDVKKSPLPFDFGVNIEGDFDHPKIRLGRGRYDSTQGEKITLANEGSPTVNLVSEAKYLADKLLKRAARW